MLPLRPSPAADRLRARLRHFALLRTFSISLNVTEPSLDRPRVEGTLLLRALVAVKENY
jgi:hypothetical protein